MAKNESNLTSYFSDFGKRIYLPNGIIIQSQEAKKKATKYNATVGTAKLNNKNLYLDSIIVRGLKSIEPSDAVAYSPMGGVAELRSLWKEHIYKVNPTLNGKNISLPIVSSGLTNALATTLSLFLDKGGSLVLPDTYWENYDLLVNVRCHADMITFPIFSGNGFNVSGYEEALTKASEKNPNMPIITILNFPNNPTGYSPTCDEAKSICNALKKFAEKGKKLIVILDDAYFGLFFEKDTYKESLFSILADLHENILAVKCDAVTKEELAWGFRVGFITYGMKNISEEDMKILETKTLATIRGDISNGNTISQLMVINGLKDPEHDKEKDKIFDILHKRYVLLKKELLKYEKHYDLLRPLPFNSGYFMSFISKEDPDVLRCRLLDKYGVGVIRLGTNIIRIAFSSVNEEFIPDLISILYTAAEEYKG